MDEEPRTLQQVTDLLGAVVRRQVGDLTDDALLGLLRQAEEVGRLADALRVITAAEVDERSRYELGRDGLAQRLGETRGEHLVERITRVSQAEATRRVRLGRAIRPRVCMSGEMLSAEFPRVAEALLSGELGVDAAGRITAALTQAARHHASPESCDAAEDALVRSAAGLSADLVGAQARLWREAIDPDGTEPRDEALRRRREFWIGREREGMTPFGGHADPVNAALLRAALTERSGPAVAPRFLSEEDALAQLQSELATPVDPRTREQKQFDVIFGLLGAGVRTGEGSVGRSLATVVAVITLDDLENGRGAGWLDDVEEPISAAAAQELACDGGIRPIVLGAHGEVLHLGRTKRLFNAAQRLALSVRDGGCVWSGCHAPPAWCHAHHVIEYSRGGRTDVDNGVLLCPAHHHALHRSDYTMRMRDGVPYLLPPPGIDPTGTWRRLGGARVGVAA